MKARRLTRRAVLERWWVLPVAGTAGAFGYMGFYATRVLRGKNEAGPPPLSQGPRNRWRPSRP
ncbi:hypothetical protein [Deinococcus multiflagellatus]|uniref:Uncharacterized protein n=1 Tax=Deinococcus multiflagellatus TaxID=1656887 RepID=A0ABW1ZG11_9DEIO